MNSIACLLRLKFRYDRGHELPGNIKFPLTKSLQMSRNELYEFLMSTPLEKEVDPAALGALVHKILIAILTAQCKVTDRIGHIFDITVPMTLYKGNGIYRSASCATKYCAQMQYCLRTVVVHIVRLGGPLAPYILFESMDTEDTRDLNEDPSIENGKELEQGEDLEEIDVVDDLYSSRHSIGFSERPVEEPLCFIDEDDTIANTGPSSSNPAKLDQNQGDDKLLV